MITSKIIHIAHSLPSIKVTNSDLVKEFPEWDVDKIESKTGIKNRYIAKDNETALDLAVDACQKITDSQEHTLSDVDALIFCTQSPDHILPPNSNLLQNRLGLSKNILAFDISHACSGFVYAISLAHSIIVSGLAKKILIVTAETYSKYISPKDKVVRTIFSDAASACIMQADDSPAQLIRGFSFYTDGSGAKHLIIPDGGCRNKAPQQNDSSRDNSVRTEQNLFMNGPEIFNFTLKIVPDLISRTLDSSQIEKEQIDYFIFHQANSFMLEYLRKKCWIDREKFIIDMQEYGNTVSSSIPIVLENVFKNNYTYERKVLIAGFGVGLSCASCIINL